MWMKRFFGVTIQDRLQTGWIRQTKNPKAVEMVGLSVLKQGTRELIEDVLGCGFGRADDGEGFGKHTLETRVCVQVNRGHETCMCIKGHGGEKRTSEHDP